ncbi:MAG TPA: flagellar hook-basal body complex protein FliE [Syntrophorhabdaceae bacterium]|nr:flagellar hook-basal body complex protein FliE [Syntrophorhabdaceae bacterium]
MKVETFQLPHFPENKQINEKKTSISFTEILKDSINKVSALEKEADEEIKKLATMENKDIHTTMIAVEKADMTFQLMMQIRNKIISAYEEIMRMQV